MVIVVVVGGLLAVDLFDLIDIKTKNTKTPEVKNKGSQPKVRFLPVIDAENNVKCPDCGEHDWLEGPGGGSFGNIQCTSCGSKFNNLGPFGLERIN